MVKKTIVIFGASSEFAREFIKVCYKNNEHLVLISRNNINTNNGVHKQTLVKDYILDLEKIIENIKNLNNCYIVFFNGVIFENRPITFPTPEEIKLTEYVNYFVPFTVTNELNKSLDNVRKYIFISSIAAVTPRRKNYIYGQNKRKLEKEIKKLDLPSSLFIRFGKINTNMSKSHKNPPFVLNPDKAAEILYSKLNSENITYPNFGLFLISLILKITPKKLIDLIGL